MNNSKRIVKVLPGSISEELGIEPGDTLVSINGNNIADMLDYLYLTTEEKILVEILKKDGDLWEFEIEKDEYEELGLEFGDPLLDKCRRCQNKCIFCFIDQLPKGLRKSLYFKDDDYRMSYLLGNYVTLSNMTDKDFERIIYYKLQPINISVHTTDPELRMFMLNNKRAGDIIEKINLLVKNEITVNCQIVLCKGINDNLALDETLKDLTDLYPGVVSISVVPSGLTEHRNGLFHLEPYDKESSLAVISQVEGWQKYLLAKYGSRIVYIADEFYVMADKKIPDYKAYEGFPQLENGVGLIALFKYSFDKMLKNIRHIDEKNFVIENKRKISVVTGISFYKYILGMVKRLEKMYNNIEVNVFEIENNFFGKSITVTGLLTGRDIVQQVKGKDLGSELLICENMLKFGEELFLDDYSVSQLQDELGVKVKVVENSGEAFVKSVLGME